jgi:multidrug efflux system membrane fusion protein
MKRKHGAPFALAVTAVFALSFYGCNQTSQQSKALIPVRTAQVSTIDVGNALRYSASIAPYTQVDLAFKSNGYVESVLQVPSANGGRRNVDQGDWVKKGTVLAVVSRQDYLDKLQQANAQASRSQAEYVKAKLSFDRTSALYSSQSATKPELDSAQAQLDSTTAAVSAAKAQVSEAQVALDYCSLSAPFDGWIVKRSVDVGSLVGPATNGFSIADTQTVKAIFGVPDIYINRARIGQRLAITTDSLPGEFEGKITAISPTADAKSRVFAVEMSILNPNNALKSGMIATLSIPGHDMTRAVTAIPISSVVRDPERQQGFAVMVAEGQGGIVLARLRSVELGDAYGNMIAVNGGLNQGEKVITTGASIVKNGDQVQIIP